MKIATIILSITPIWQSSTANGAECNPDDHHPENGGYFVEGINGHVRDVAEPGTKRRMTNNTWAPGIKYPDGSLEYCTGMYCEDKCRNDGCPSLITGTTCSMIRFCYESDSGSDVWLMPNEDAMLQCDFTEATQVCGPEEGSDNDCCNHKVEVDHEIKLYLFASKEGCSSGQKAAVQVDDFTESGDQCYEMGLSSSRIQKCTCNYEDSEMSTLVEPCHSQFIRGCNHHAPDLGDDESCCDTDSCVGKHLDINDPIGKAKEEERKLLCQDTLPGRCLHSVDNTDDCCNSRCTTCGADKDPFLQWAACTSGNATSNTAVCGYGGHGGMFSQYECDFSKCTEGQVWHVGGDMFKSWMSTADPENYNEANIKMCNIITGSGIALIGMALAWL